jgi:chemotaxis protein histidine kinase CheA
MTSTTNATQLRFNTKTKGLSVPDELYWYNNNTNWNALSRKEFRSLMIRMESITAQHYEDVCTTGRSNRSAAIKAFWANEWGCEYQPESGKWLNLTTNAFFQSETEKKAQRDAKKASKEEKKAAKKVKQTAQYNDEEEEVYVQAAQKQQTQQQHQQQQQQQTQSYDDWFDAEEEAYAEAYAQARAQEEQRAQAQEAQQAQVKAYLDSLMEEQEEEEEEEQEEEQEEERIACQAVFYLEELTYIQGDPDWRAYIYYDERIRRYVLKGTRRSVLNCKKKTVYPEMKLCFRSSRELASFLCSSTETLNVTMFAMTGATVRNATFAELYALPARGCKTELFGYDQTRPRYSTFVSYLRMVRDMDASHSDFAAF